MARRFGRYVKHGGKTYRLIEYSRLVLGIRRPKMVCYYTRYKITPIDGGSKRQREHSPAKTKTSSKKPAEESRANPLVRRVLKASGTQEGAPQSDAAEQKTESEPADAEPADTEPADSGPAQTEPADVGPVELVREESALPAHAGSNSVVDTVPDSLQSTERIQPAAQDHQVAPSNSDENLSHVDALGAVGDRRDSGAASGQTEPQAASPAPEVIQDDGNDTDLEILNHKPKDVDLLTSAVPLQLVSGAPRVPCFALQTVYPDCDHRHAVTPSFVEEGVPVLPRPAALRCTHATQLPTPGRCR